VLAMARLITGTEMGTNKSMGMRPKPSTRCMTDDHAADR
jgi:hypothetical protein